MFIELTSLKGQKVSINDSKVQFYTPDKANDGTDCTCIVLDQACNSFIRVKETYEEVQNKINFRPWHY